MNEPQALDVTQHFVQSKDVFVFRMNKELPKEVRAELSAWWDREWAPGKAPPMLLIPRTWGVEHTRDGKVVTPEGQSVKPLPRLHHGTYQAAIIIGSLVLAIYSVVDGTALAALGWLTAAIAALTCDCA